MKRMFILFYFFPYGLTHIRCSCLCGAVLMCSHKAESSMASKHISSKDKQSKPTSSCLQLLLFSIYKQLRIIPKKKRKEKKQIVSSQIFLSENRTTLFFLCVSVMMPTYPAKAENKLSSTFSGMRT